MSKYHIVRTTSNVDGTPIEDVLPPCFGSQTSKDQTEQAISLDCSNSEHKNFSWSEHVEETPKLSEYVFSEADILDCLSLGCENLTSKQSEDIVSGVGVGKWTAEPDLGGV